jgi:hypothetical protein
MIEQTELVVAEWKYNPPANPSEGDGQVIKYIDFDVMKKRVSTKKGIACRFSCRFDVGTETILSYVGEDSYVIDLDDFIDMNELKTMIRNSYSKFTDKFEFNKLSTVLNNISLPPLDESLINYDVILPLLV